MTSRKITFHVIKFYENQNNNMIHRQFDFDSFVNWFNQQSAEDIVYNISAKKFTSLDLLEQIPSRFINSHPKAYFGMMSTGNHGSRRNLKDSVDNSRRENPKRIEEGEEQENYFILGFTNNGEIDLILQNAGSGIKNIHLKNYLDKFIQKYLNSIGESKEFKIVEGPIVSSVDVMVNRLERVIKTKVFVDKSILDNDNLGYSNRTLSSRSDLIIDVRAERGKDIRDFLEDMRQKMLYDTKIDKIWIEGKDNHGNISQFYIDEIQKHTFISVEIDPHTAALFRDDIRDKMVRLL